MIKNCKGKLSLITAQGQGQKAQKEDKIWRKLK